jgi:hypothetical protein
VQIDGIQLTFLDIPAELTQEYNRWYDLDHMPEHVSKADVVMGRRYVAPRELRGLDGAQPAELFGGHPPYATIYFSGGLDFTSDEARNGWTTMDRRIVKAGRYWKEGHATHSASWRLGGASARAGVLVAEPAIPHLNHRGAIFALGRAPSAERRQEAIGWWTGTHLVDLFAVPGVLAALRGDPVSLDPELLLHVILCEDPPAEVLARIHAAMRYARAVGRYPAHAGVYESIAFLPYDRIVPLEYDFDVSLD